MAAKKIKKDTTVSPNPGVLQNPTVLPDPIPKIDEQSSKPDLSKATASSPGVPDSTSGSTSKDTASDSKTDNVAPIHKVIFSIKTSEDVSVVPSISKRSISDLLNINSALPCPFPAFSFAKPLQCTHALFIFSNVSFSPGDLSSFTGSVLQLLSLKTVIKKYASTFIIKNGNQGTITIVVSFKSRSTISKPVNFVFKGHEPTIHPCPKGNNAFRYLVLNFNNIHPFHQDYFLSDCSLPDLID
jgi:hypothetical protein